MRKAVKHYFLGRKTEAVKFPETENGSVLSNFSKSCYVNRFEYCQILPGKNPPVEKAVDNVENLGMATDIFPGFPVFAVEETGE